MRKLLITASICLLGTAGRGFADLRADEVPPPRKKTAPRELMLTNQRTYRLGVQRVDSRIYVKLEKHWDFGDALPVGLPEAIRRSRKAKTLPARDKSAKRKADLVYIRWQPDKKRKNDAGALLWINHASKRKLLGVSIDLVIDRNDNKKAAPLELKFDELHLTVDVEKARISRVRWKKRKLPDVSRKSRDVRVEDAVEVDAIGTLTAKSSKSLETADELFSGEVMQKLRLLGWSDLRNNSHHGITLGWLGYEHLRHNLFLLPGKPGEPVAFRYRVSGKSFPLTLVRRQLGDGGWPMVLTGRQYVGTSKDGARVFRPLEFVLSKRPAKKPRK